MLRANFFFKFLKHKKHTSQEIIKFNSNQKLAIEDQINLEIIEIDQEISYNSKALLEAQIVKIRSTFSKSNNFIDKIGKNVYKKKLDESINWHQKKVKELYMRRRRLEINLEKLKGIFWLNRIKKVLGIILIGFFLLISLFIFLSGFMIIIYLLPLIILIFLLYWISTRKY